MPPTERTAIGTLALSAIATACRVEEHALQRATRLDELNLDSLTLIWIASRVEAECSVTLTTDETLRLFAASTVGELIDELEAAATVPAAE
jgi:acyl carrier protein